MTAITAAPTTAAPTQTKPLAVRRWFLVASPVLAGFFAVIGAYADPAQGLDGRALLELYGANPGPLQLKSLALHWSYAFWIVPALLAVPYIRRKGAWLANVAGLIGFAGLATLPGLLFIDYYDSAIAQEFGADGAVAVGERMNDMWGVPVFVMPGVIGFVLALPLIAMALWRAGLVRWWAPVSVVAASVAVFASSVSWWGCAIATACLAVFSVALERGTRPGMMG